MMNYIEKKIDQLMLKKVIKNNFSLTEKEITFMKRYGKDQTLMTVLEKIALGAIFTSVKTKTREGIIARDEWVKCIGYIKKLMEEDKKPKINRITGKPFSDK